MLQERKNLQYVSHANTLLFKCFNIFRYTIFERYCLIFKTDNSRYISAKYNQMKYVYHFNSNSYPCNDIKYVLRHIVKHLIVFRISAVSLIGIFGNTFNIGVLISTRKNSNFTQTFLKLLVLLSTFDLLYLLIVIGIFGLPALSPWYNDNIYIKILPTW